MKHLFIVLMLAIALATLFGLGYLIGHKEGYKQGYIDRSNSLIEVRFPNGAVAESIDAVENYGY